MGSVGHKPPASATEIRPQSPAARPAQHADVPPLTIASDLAICRACAEEVQTPGSRRFRYPFAHCNDCGPRFSVLKRLPYEHANTAFSPFDRCFACDSDYFDPENRHFHAETAGCPQCGPRVELVRFDGGPIPIEQHTALDDVDAACSLIQKGEIVAIKGIGGWQLACDATNLGAVARLRFAKQNDTRPLPLLARDLHIVARYCAISVAEEFQLTGPERPIVILRTMGSEKLPLVAPGRRTLGFMLPSTALQLLLMQRMNRPVVMTSANLSGDPQIIDDHELRQTLGVAVRFGLTHNYRIANRVEDSVVRVMGSRPRLVRRGKGYAPAELPLPDGFERASDIIAIGGDRNAAFSLLKRGVAIPSPHYGNVADMEDWKTYQRAICQYRRRLNHQVCVVAIDAQQEDLSSAMSRSYTAHWQLGLIEVTHYHAHIASCLAENGFPTDGPPVLGIVLDGLGWDEENSREGSEFMLANYRTATPLATLKPVLLPAREAALREPWRDLFAHITAAMGWEAFTAMFGTLDLWTYLRAKGCGDPATTPQAGLRYISSCGRLFDAVAVALAVWRERQTYDGEAAMRLEAIVDERALADADPHYPVLVQTPGAPQLPFIDPGPMWQALLADLMRGTTAGVVAARFHRWLASSLLAMALELTWSGSNKPAAALSGGCFQNRILFEETERLLRLNGFAVFSQAQMPPHNGGLCLGQVAVSGAQLIDRAAQRS